MIGKPTNSMRLFAFPLTASRDLSIRRSGHRHPLIYYYAQMPKRNTGSDEEQPTLLKRAQAKASQMWSNWGKASGGWKLKVHTYGEKLVDRIDFEELALASIDTSLGPKISRLGTHSSMGKELSKQQAKTHDISIPLIYPPSYMSVNPLASLQQQLVLRSPLHRRKTWFWVGIIPFTAPFMLIPVIPNLPFFFCVWRAWTHWKAHKASTYLLELSNEDAIHASPSEDLDEVYSNASKFLPDPSPRANNEHNDLKVDSSIALLLPNPVPTISDIVDTYSLPKEAKRSFLRAVEQAKIRSQYDEAKTDT